MLNAIAFDWETSKKPILMPWQDGSFGVSLHIYMPDGTRKTWLFNHPDAHQTPRECVDEIQQVFDNAELLVAHNAKFDLHWCRQFGIEVNVPIHCTLLTEYVLDGHATNMQDLSLNDLAERYDFALKKDKVKEYWDAGYQTDEIPVDILTEYGEYDCELAWNIAMQQLDTVEIHGLSRLIRLEMESLKCFQEMEWNGMLLDVGTLSQYAEEYSTKLEQLDQWLENELGIPSISSGDMLSCGLFGGTFKVEGRVPGKRPGTMKNGKIDVTIDGAGFKPKEEWALKKDGMYSTAIDTLTELKGRTKKQKLIKEKLLERSRIDQLNKTYFKGLLKRVGEDGYIHGNLNQCITKTGRLSSSNPNLQNIPRGDTGPVKKIFITRF